MSCKCKWCIKQVYIDGFLARPATFVAELPKDLRIVDKPESCFETELIRKIKKIDCDYFTVTNRSGLISFWSTPDRVKPFIRNKKLMELGL